MKETFYLPQQFFLKVKQMFYNHPGVADAYLNNAKSDRDTAIQPLPESKPTYWLDHELWLLTSVRSIFQLQAWFDKIDRGKDAIFSFDDPLPFLTVHHWQIPLLLIAYDIDKQIDRQRN
jgi:hypothetical protein